MRVAQADHKAVNHVVQMHQSQCFQQTSGANKLGCISCHDPHVFVPPEQRAAYYRPRCLECHAAHGCTVPEATRRKQSKDDNCIQCHMPPYSGATYPTRLGPITASCACPGLTDRPNSASPPPANEPPLVSFHRGRVDRQDRQLTRDLAMLASVNGTGSFTAADAARWSLDVLQETVTADPGDLDAQEVRAKDLAHSRGTKALMACEALAAKAPGRESPSPGRPHSPRHRGRHLALTYWRRAVSLSPERGLPRPRGSAIGETPRLDELGPASLEWVRREPGGLEARLLRVRYLFHAGDRAGAATEFAKVRALYLPNLDQLEKRYAPLLH